ncbi:hypothetical protein C9426_23910 [Serratia sp. S1B]|nr:hypothetical protein C9426_23910 [Serratia sp. S1B]
MTKEEKFTLLKLQAFTTTELEQYRERGEEARLRLSSAVIRELELPDYWSVDCEQRQEWCGVHPVHLRLSHQSAPEILIDILSPCNDSPYWYCRLWFERAKSVAWFYSAENFDPEAIRDMFRHLDEYIRAGFTGANELAAALRLGGKAV